MMEDPHMTRTLSLTAALLLAWTSLGLAQPGPAERARHHQMEQRHDLIEQLGLSEDQEAQMKQLHLDLQKKQTQLQSKVQLARIAMKEAMLASQPEKSAFEKQIKAINDLQLEMKMNRLDHWFKVYTLMKPDQQETWKEHFGERSMMEEHGPSGMRPSPGGPRGRR